MNQPESERPTDAAGETPDRDENRSPLYGRISDAAAEARRERESFDPPADPPAEDRALAYCRDGLGTAVSAYVEARTGEWVRLSETEMNLLDRAANDWLELYALCYGVEIDADFTVREAAEMLVKTHNVRDVAALLTCVPDR
jgi:hypothetical protein